MTKPKTEAELQLERKRADKAARQLRWRHRAAKRQTPLKQGASVSIHLTSAECAALDAIAQRIYREHPHDPRGGKRATVFPGRAEALRQLIRQWRIANPNAPRLGSRERCAAFWRAEAAWRNVRDPETELEAPTPPWA